MMTLRLFSLIPAHVPTATTWSLADISEARGKQELFTRQSPQRLKALREHAMIESAVSSNRIEGVEIDAARVKTVVLGRPALRDRNEEEIRGYRDALQLIHQPAPPLPISEDAIKRLHKLSRGEVWDAGRYKERDVAINPGGPPLCEFPRPSILLAPAFMPSISPPARKNCHARRLDRLENLF